MNEKLDLVEIEKFYNEHEAIWYDNWYRYTNKSIELFLKNNCSFNNDDIIQLEIDEQSSVPLEVQKKIIQTNQKYFAHLMQKENLEFYKDKE